MARLPQVQQLYSPQLAQLQWLLRTVKMDKRIAPGEFHEVSGLVDKLMRILMVAQMKPLNQPQSE